ncbi:hypothetical protein [Dyadobacter sp. NIV53]|uniref:hypothetical protein n=1 Tax=Dyadobacter sp. NIV53 TaxID=2861765 RepID=UPI001C86BDEB|nr:hypothetical protein [Dyadobacter sp. NIV53]
MNYLSRILCLSAFFLGNEIMAQDSTGLSGTPYQEVQSNVSPYLFKEWYSGTVRTDDDNVHDGVLLRYDIVKDELEYKAGSSLYRVKQTVKEFTIPSGTDLYIFKSGFPATENNNGKSFYRVMYDGETKLLKRYQTPIKIEKANATREMEPDAKLYIVKGDKVTQVYLKDKNSFLKLLSDEKNKMQYVIKEEQLEFDGDDDLARLLEEYDSYKAGRGGN